MSIKRGRWSAIEHVNSTNSPNEEVVAACEKDNSYLFDADGSMSLDYGEDTGEGECVFDDLEVYDKWYISEDGNEFFMEEYNVFTPNIVEVDTFQIKTLEVDLLELEQTVDWSGFGEREEEVFFI